LSGGYQMKKIHKNKFGFTLLEIVIVIAIIVILSSVLFFSVASYLNRAKAAKSKVSSANASFSTANSKINSKFVDLGY
jgi:prepilin-type N-terminal cleavage/methylation domain-containing protein